MNKSWIPGMQGVEHLHQKKVDRLAYYGKTNSKQRIDTTAEMGRDALVCLFVDDMFDVIRTKFGPS